MEQKTPKVSVVTACYNAGRFVRQTLDSVLNQTFQNFEYICVDDCSQDNTWDILQEYAKGYPEKMRIFKNQCVNGEKAQSSFNLAFSKTRGEYVQTVDHDDQLSVDYLEKCLRRVEETHCDAVVPDCVLYDGATGKVISASHGCKGDYDAILSNREAVVYSLDWGIHGFVFWKGDVARKIAFLPYVFDSGELASRQRYFLSSKVAFCDAQYKYYQWKGSAVHRPFSRYSHTRLTTNREVLKLLTENDFNVAVINRYQVQTYRLFCGTFSRFIASQLFYRDGVARRSVLQELKQYYSDADLLNRPRLYTLCPSFLDKLRLNSFWMTIPVTYWRKILNRVLKDTSMF